jgi:multidrug efflux pump subunit AcrA (membrane-fusion protein)
MFMKWSTENSSHKAVDKRKKWRRSALILMCGVMLLTSACSLLPDEEQEEALPTITPPAISKKPEYDVMKGDWISDVKATGKVMSEQEETFFFTLDNKPVKDVKVKNGDNVKSGQVLAVLDVEDMQRDLRAKRRDLRKQEMKMKETLRQKDEMDPLLFEDEQIAYEEALEKIAEVETDIAKGSVTAPFAGTVVSVSTKKGNMTKKYDPVATIANTSRLVVTVDVAKEDLKKIAPGMEVELSINATGKIIKGKVKALPAPSSDKDNGGNNNNPGGGNVPEQDRIDKYVTVSLNEKLPSTVTRGSMLGATIITKKRSNVVYIPPSALRTLGARTYVQVVDDNGKREVDVEIGEQDSTRVEIKKGLEPGQKVVGR